MGIPVFLLILLIIVFLANRGSRQSARKRSEERSAFWEREMRANTARKQDISNLNFITLPECLSSASGCVSEEILDTEAALRDLSDKKMVNFAGSTNTDLKLTYGAANFPLLSEYDSNYIKLVQLIQKYARELCKEGMYERARSVLSFGLSVAPEVTSMRKLLDNIPS